MPSIADNLKEIVQPRKEPVSGTVQSVSGNVVYVVTSKGVITAAGQGTGYPAGSTVRVENGVVRAKIAGTNTLPVYRV